MNLLCKGERSQIFSERYWCGVISGVYDGRFKEEVEIGFAAVGFFLAINVMNVSAKYRPECNLLRYLRLLKILAIVFL